jgi:RNAse (barnase) inhibitor barstar
VYRLVDEGSGDLMVVAEEIEGFFVDDPESTDPVVMVDVRETGTVSRSADDAVLRIRDDVGRSIGQYLVGRVRGGVLDAVTEDDRSTVCAIFPIFHNRCEYPLARQVWKRWIAGPVLKNGEWLTLPSAFHESWLHVVQNRWFATGHDATLYGDRCSVELEGATMTTPAAFYCAIGEGVNGPGGYFGSNLDALADCLSNAIRDGARLTIHWGNFDQATASLGPAYTASIIDVFREFKVPIDMK